METTNGNFCTTSDGAHIYFEDTGKGKPIVMIPGFLCTTKFFRRNVAGLSGEYRMITMDPRGQGNSSKSPGNTLKRHAQDIKELVDYLGLEDIILLGWSVGSSTVLTYAADHNEHRLAGLALVDGSLHPFSGDNWNKHRARGYNIANWFDTYLPLAYHPTEFYEKFAQRISNHGSLPTEDREWFFAEFRKTMPWTALENHYDFCHTNNMPNLEKLTVPVAIFGADSEAYGLEMVTQYQQCIRSSVDVYRFYESGHLMFYYEAEKFNHCLHGFAQKVYRTSSVLGG